MSGVPGTPKGDGKPWNLQQIMSDIQEGRLDSCGALVEALNIAENDNSRSKILPIINNLSDTAKGRAALIAAGACGALVEALKVAEADDSRIEIEITIENLCEVQEGCSDACRALLEAFKIAKTMSSRSKILPIYLAMIHNLSDTEKGCAALIAAGACGALVEALKVAETEKTYTVICEIFTKLGFTYEEKCRIADC
jgi:hypothetical protein